MSADTPRPARDELRQQVANAIASGEKVRNGCWNLDLWAATDAVMPIIDGLRAALDRSETARTEAEELAYAATKWRERYAERNYSMRHARRFHAAERALRAAVAGRVAP